jgi:hypothetical protein
MARIMIACPSTKQLLYTGASSEHASFDDPRTVHRSGSTYCPHCRQPHSWAGEETVLEAGDQPHASTAALPRGASRPPEVVGSPVPA